MPDKQNENKFMAMLERKGIVSKVDSENKQAETSPEASSATPREELSSMFGHPKPNDQDVKLASRQPVPGMINPTIPAENRQPQDTTAETRPAETAVPTQASEPVETGNISFEQPRTIRISNDISKEVPSEAPVQSVYKDVPSEQPPQNVHKEVLSETPPQSVYKETPSEKPPQSAYIERTNNNQDIYQEPLQTQQPPPPPPPPQRTTDKYMDINEIYAALSLPEKRTDTIYLVEEYIKTIPDSLPAESRREIVNKIVSASGFDYEMLMGDGVLRVKMIKDYAEKFARHTEEYVSVQNAELAELEKQMQRVKSLIENRRELHKRQFFTIEAEAQRLKEILLFVSG